ncbi:ROK family glucokinase [Aeromicrobium wangtongii]|uniref:Glucokinase n=1 Tax=Aeromicrobium wangtongii TaxID=2969247 RepID=A0ABY5MA61_9ACTN|nr:ROK family glucokinase [Aeromicrobium wangtongii]MCD9197529.1 ROK family glucokinase [Aeromicrobium wangtongii]UUP15020.1 ROK family glucokinase [Aeromicrobium wangtongii]
MVVSLGIDIGGTKIAAGIVDADGRVLDRVRRDTPTTDPLQVIDAIADITELFRKEHHIRAIGIGAAGFVDATQSTVLFAPHLAWRHEPLRDAVARRTRLPVLVDNDANAAGWAEWRFGAAQNETDLVLITLGTGIGGALVIDGQPYRGKFGIAGEFGHMQVVPGGLSCPCGNRGCWEQYASGRVLTRRAREAADDGTPFGVELLSDAGGDVLAIGGAHVTAHARRGNKEAMAWIADVGDWLGVGIANLAAALDPGTFVIGGGVSDAGELLLAPTRAAFSRTLTGRGYRAEARIVQAHLGPEAGLIGAADMARLTARRRRPASPGARARVRAAARTGRSPRPRR